MKKFIISVSALAMPLMAGAVGEGVSNITTIINKVRDVFTTLIPLLMMVVVAVFLWGIVKYITAAGDEEKAKVAKGYIIYGLIGLFVMIAMWGIVSILATTLGVTPGGTITPPTFNPSY